MSTNGLKELIATSINSIKSMVDVNNVVGEPFTAPDGSIIIPVTKMTCGFGAGGYEAQKETAAASGLDYPFSGGSGGGMKVDPIAFLVISGGNVRIVPVQGESSGADKIIDLIPQMVDKVNGIIKDYTKKEEPKQEEPEQKE